MSYGETGLIFGVLFQLDTLTHMVIKISADFSPPYKVLNLWQEWSADDSRIQKIHQAHISFLQVVISQYIRIFIHLLFLKFTALWLNYECEVLGFTVNQNDGLTPLSYPTQKLKYLLALVVGSKKLNSSLLFLRVLSCFLHFLFRIWSHVPLSMPSPFLRNQWDCCASGAEAEDIPASLICTLSETCNRFIAHKRYAITFH